jgi:hypothetical protein
VNYNIQKKSHPRYSYELDDIVHSRFRDDCFDTVVSTFGLMRVAEVELALG